MTDHENFCRWAARTLLSELRTGGAPDGLEASDLVWDPMLRCLREEVTDADRDIILGLIGRQPTRMFGALLSRGLLDDQAITDALIAAYRVERQDDRKLGLFHQLTARSTSAEVRDELASWAEANAELLISEQGAFFAGEGVRARLNNRLQDQGFATKRWVYMYSAHALGDRMTVRAFIEPFLHDADPLVARAAAASLRTLDT